MAQVPYEFLVRWDHLTGEYKGSHVKLYDNVTMREGDAQSVAVASVNGFPLSLILTAIEQGAIITADNAQAALAAKQIELDNEKAAHAATVAAKDTEIAALKAQIAGV